MLLKTPFLSLHFSIDFGRGLGRVWGGFGEGLGRVFGGLGKDFCQDFENFAIILTLIFFIVLFFGIAIFIFDKAVNTPKYQNKISSVITNKFFYLPDIIKSSVMILSGRRSFSNLFNDYNIKFLPETQYININLERKRQR